MSTHSKLKTILRSGLFASHSLQTFLLEGRIWAGTPSLWSWAGGSDRRPHVSFLFITYLSTPYADIPGIASLSEFQSKFVVRFNISVDLSDACPADRSYQKNNVLQQWGASTEKCQLCSQSFQIILQINSLSPSQRLDMLFTVRLWCSFANLMQQHCLWL